MKRIITLIFIISIVCSSLALATDFKDVSSSHWAYNNIKDMQSKSTLNGFDDGTFKPDSKITREQFAEMLVNTLNLNENRINFSSKDIELDRWSKNAIDIADDYIPLYYIDGEYQFKPEEEISRIHAFISVARVLHIDQKAMDINVLNKFVDNNQIPSVWKNQVTNIVSYGIINGDADKKLNPWESLTRAEAVTMLINVLRIQNPNIDGTGNTEIEYDELNTNEKYIFLKSYGVVDSKFLNEENNYLSEEDALKSVVKLIGYENLATSIEKAYHTNNYLVERQYPYAIEKNNLIGYYETAFKTNILVGFEVEKLNPNRKITYEEYLKMIVNAMGYSDMIKYTNYTQQATSIGIISKEDTIELKNNITYADATKILYNAMNSAPWVYKGEIPTNGKMWGVSESDLLKLREGNLNKTVELVDITKIGTATIVKSKDEIKAFTTHFEITISKEFAEKYDIRNTELERTLNSCEEIYRCYNKLYVGNTVHEITQRIGITSSNERLLEKTLNNIDRGISSLFLHEIAKIFEDNITTYNWNDEFLVDLGEKYIIETSGLKVIDAMGNALNKSVNKETITKNYESAKAEDFKGSDELRGYYYLDNSLYNITSKYGWNLVIETFETMNELNSQELTSQKKLEIFISTLSEKTNKDIYIEYFNDEEYKFIELFLENGI